jgi:hypothetical protein
MTLTQPLDSSGARRRARDARSLRSVDTTSDAALIERLQMLRSILPGMATEVAIARREAARLRRENATLQGRLIALEGHGPATRIPA